MLLRNFKKISITSYLRDPVAVYAKLKKGRNIRASFFNVKRLKLLCSDLQTCGALLTLVNKNTSPLSLAEWRHFYGSIIETFSPHTETSLHSPDSSLAMISSVLNDSDIRLTFPQGIVV